MKKIYLIIVLSLVYFNSLSQTVSCSDLLDFIKDEGVYKYSLSGLVLDSSWLSKVTAYDYEYKTYVIAEIKENEYSYTTKTYIFCGIPAMNWSNFRFGGYGDSDSYGERFHKYIIDYQCNCR